VYLRVQELEHRRLASDRFARRHRKEGKAAFIVESDQNGAKPDVRRIQGAMSMNTAPAGKPPPGWDRIADDVRGVPLWKRQDEPCYVATRDTDQLLFIGAALARFDRMSGEEFHEFVSSR
jgi:hypothetical protein